VTAYPPILDSIRARHARYGWSVPTGEWGLIQSQHRRLLRAALDADNVAALDALLRRMFRGDLAFGLVSMPRDPATTLPRQVTWRLALWAKTTDAPDLRRLAAPDIGAPVVIYADGPDTAPVPLMPDVCRFDTYARRIARVLPPDGTVLEFGGGYGGTALQVLRSNRINPRLDALDAPSKGTGSVVFLWAEFEHVEEYKTAYNMFTEKGFTPAHREETESYYGDLFAQ
jgi:hypothetical protein